ncbi:hypothetical protein DMN91_006051 [Ooceraea biroi]|uniref:Transferrin n=1 Tax=Ooceraea biroi TaxID=2015173 RepID=A0A026WSE4_OOCBI|nr:transferrin [Ooceraea biroi]EZA58009.1 Transferrin [Ooceraea biroi]RLU21675.1 hypothetical protein DMN91_006051 [Ooceraea biroi]
MRNIVWVILLVACATHTFAHVDRIYRLCAPFDTISEDTCYALQKGENEVICSRVEDSAECAIRLASGDADFGIFTAEELLLAYKFYPTIRPIFQLRHRDKQQESFEFETVAVIPADLTQISVPPHERLQNLRNSGFCHPGFSKSQWWNDYILKYFERSVNRIQCQENVTLIENEVRSLRNFFGKACRPGDWAAEKSVDTELKRKYPQLCALCDDPTTCSYKNELNHGHLGALECLARGSGKVAYVALSYVQQYLGRNESFQFLCKDGSVMPLSTINPCTWVRQPWSVIAAKKEIAETTPLKTKLSEWLRPPVRDDWKIALNSIIQEDKQMFNITENMSMVTYLSTGRDVDLTATESCGRTIRWCTISDMETTKCNWVARATLALGVAPKISCVQAESTFQCFRDIADDRVDVITIDSNYGYLARTVYGLSTILYSETEMDRNSVIIAVVPEPNDDNYPVKNFQDLKNRKVCFPEYGGIGWLSFVNTVRTRGLISDSCDYPKSISKFLSGACTPGIKDIDHSRTRATTDISTKLCSACPNESNTSCAANETNHYYGDKGAMQCISDGKGDLAIVEAGNIIDGTIDPNMFRILCKNGSLARNTGFKYDEFCALSVTIDSEVVGRKNDTSFKTDIVLALLKMEDWLGYRVNTRRPIHIYGKFNGTLDLLFKDTSSGLVSTSSQKKSIIAYKELFSHVEECSNGSLIATANFIFVVLIALYHLLPVH